MLGAANRSIKHPTTPGTHSLVATDYRNQNPETIVPEVTVIRQTTFSSAVNRVRKGASSALRTLISYVRSSRRETGNQNTLPSPAITASNNSSVNSSELCLLSPISVDLLQQRINSISDLPDTYYHLEQQGLHDLLIADFQKLFSLLKNYGVNESVLEPVKKPNPESSSEDIEQQIEQMKAIVCDLTDRHLDAKRNITDPQKVRDAFNQMIAHQEKIRNTYINASQQFRQNTQQFNKGLRTDFDKLQNNVNELNDKIKLFNNIQRQLATNTSG